MQHGEYTSGGSDRDRVRAGRMPVDTDDNPGQEHRGRPEEHHDWIAETHVEFFFHISTPFCW